MGAVINVSFTKSRNSNTKRETIDDDRGNKENYKLWATASSIDRQYNRDRRIRKSEESISNKILGFDSKLNNLLTNTTLSPIKSGGIIITQATITIYNVTRRLLMSRIQCRAENSKSLLPVSSSATLDMNCEYCGNHIYLI